MSIGTDIAVNLFLDWAAGYAQRLLHPRSWTIQDWRVNFSHVLPKSWISDYAALWLDLQW